MSVWSYRQIVIDLYHQIALTYVNKNITAPSPNKNANVKSLAEHNFAVIM